MGKEDKPIHSHKSENNPTHVVSNNTKLIQDPKPPLENTNLATLCPFTPNPTHENGDSLSSATSPLSSPRSPTLDPAIPSESAVGPALDDSPRTPREGVFDPFAPGPDHLLLAPLSKKLLTDSAKLVARRLDFDDGVAEVEDDAKDECALSEKLFLDAVYGTLIEVIVEKQIEDFVAQNQPTTPKEEPCTPTSPPRLNGVADTCPGAPVKTVSRKSRNVNPGWCRKLEF